MIEMKLLAIQPERDKNANFLSNPHTKDAIDMAISYYSVIGYNRPWICYLSMVDTEIVGVGAFKGQPQNGKVEIAYSTFEPFREQGFATKICGALVDLAIASDQQIYITARTLREENPSTSVLKKNGFLMTGEVLDPEDGLVWEWVFNKQ